MLESYGFKAIDSTVALYDRQHCQRELQWQLIDCGVSAVVLSSLLFLNKEVGDEDRATSASLIT